MSNRIKALLLGVGTVLCLILTIACRMISDNREVPFEKVQATVVTSETRQRIVAGRRQNYYYVTVRYEGETYELKNVHNTYSYKPGNKTTAYLSNGTLYANEEGVQTSTPIFYAYIGFLIATFVLFIVFLSSLPGLFKKS